MSEPFLGEIRMGGWNFAPQGWALCNGQLLSISQNTALFSLLGTTYGGNGQTTFALPDLRGRVPVHFGQGPGLSNYDQGQVGGTESVTLTPNQMPVHNHHVNSYDNQGSSGTPTGNFPAADGTGFTADWNDTSSTQMAPGMLTNSGGGQPHSNIQPFLTVNFVIALQGIFPSRN
jgi:microcystin-dependent protein